MSAKALKLCMLVLQFLFRDVRAVLRYHFLPTRRQYKAVMSSQDQI